MSSSDQSYRKYLDPDFVSKLKSIELKARLVVEGFMVGLHKSPYHGFSVEFSQHRPYMQGDPIKNIDWKVYAKSEKFYIKQFEEETNLLSHVILDVSKSMAYKGNGPISKYEYASILASALMYIMIGQQDATGFISYSDKIKSYIPPRSNKMQLKNLLNELAETKPDDATETAKSLNSVSEKINRRGLVVIISDFFDNIEEIMNALKRLHFRKNEILVFQILDPVEKNFSFDRESIFVDMETGEEMNSQPRQIQKAYQDAFAEFMKELKTGCLNFGIDYNCIDTTTPFDKALLSYFRKRSKLI